MEFFKQFNVVLNGLDNLDARRHVNRLCLASDVPLVESGTTGFLGQVLITSSKFIFVYFISVTCVNHKTFFLLYKNFLVISCLFKIAVVL